MYKKQSATRSLLVKNLPGILNTNCITNSLRTKIFEYDTDVYAIFVSLNKGENHKDQLTSELEHLPVSKQ